MSQKNQIIARLVGRPNRASPLDKGNRTNVGGSERGKT
jgi:hypothetical protein